MLSCCGGVRRSCWTTLAPPVLAAQVVGAKGLKGSFMDRMDAYVRLEVRKARPLKVRASSAGPGRVKSCGHHAQPSLLLPPAARPLLGPLLRASVSFLRVVCRAPWRAPAS